MEKEFNGLYLKNTKRAIDFLIYKGYKIGSLNSSEYYILIYDGMFSTHDFTKNSKGDFTKFRDKVSNGCGSKSGWIKPPNFLFLASCNKHDEQYTIGGTEEDRLEDDNELYRLSILDTERSKGFDRYYFKMWAYAYYKAVRLFGSKYFRYNDESKIN